jgi:DNA-binding XRE family transcriptional regulator
MELKILSQLDRRERRHVIRTFLTQIKPWLKRFKTGAIDHTSKGVILDQRVVARGVSTSECAPVHSAIGGLGFEIRMKRLELGLSQGQLSRKLGIRRSTLSNLERGIHLPNYRTCEELAKILDFPQLRYRRKEPEEGGDQLMLDLA